MMIKVEESIIGSILYPFLRISRSGRPYFMLTQFNFQIVTIQQSYQNQISNLITDTDEYIWIQIFITAQTGFLQTELLIIYIQYRILFQEKGQRSAFLQNTVKIFYIFQKMFFFIFPRYLVILFQSPINMKTKLLLVLLLPTICLAQQLCYFPPPASLADGCNVTNTAGGCQICNTGFQLLLSNCYPPCPSGWIQLMPSYCINQTVIDQNQNFLLCSTNATSPQNPNSLSMCYTPPSSTCKCGPPCPTGYFGIGCNCQYVGTSSSSNLSSENEGWLYVFAIIGMMSSILAVCYTLYKIWKNNTKPQVAQSNGSIEITSRNAGLISGQA